MNCLVEKRLLVLHDLSAMKRSCLRVLALCLISPLPALAQPASKQSETTAKKGIGLAERHGMGEPQLTALKAGWYYNWGSETKLKSSATFVPMIFSIKHVDDRVQGADLLVVTPGKLVDLIERGRIQIDCVKYLFAIY